MTYRITGLSPAPFSDLFALSEAELSARNAVRVTATSKPGFPCRITLDDADVGEELILLHHVSHDVASPYRSAYAIYVRASEAVGDYVDEVPPVLKNRPIALRGFDDAGMLCGASLASPGEADAKVRELFAQPDIAYIHAHNAAHGCFAARIDRA